MNGTVDSIPVGLCQCGCGGKTPLARKTSTRDGTVKGIPVRFCWRHASYRGARPGIPVIIDGAQCVQIPLTQGQTAIIDACDYEYIGKFRWQAKRVSHLWYAKRVGRNDSKKCDIFMHEELLPVASGMVVDHRDRDGLNNRRRNLRPATHLQNNMNRVVFKSESGYKGVRRSKNRWRASIGINWKRISLGSFATAEDAARAYNEAALRLYGEFARLNEVG